MLKTVFSQKKTIQEECNGHFPNETFGRTEIAPKMFVSFGGRGHGGGVCMGWWGVRWCFKTCLINYQPN